ncbi:MAG: LysM peptidoglycan-binding domain-containing protein [Salinivirgaceae bacterium]
MSNTLYLSFGVKTETGIDMKFNTDAFVEFDIAEGHVFAVCDGHNGVEGHGALASKMVAESIRKYFFNRTYSDFDKAITNAVVYANYTLYQQTLKNEKYQGIGSTLAILIVKNNKVYYAYAGDSRIYHLRDGKLQLLTRDHVETPEYPNDAEVTILLGHHKDIKFGVCKQPLTIETNDLFLLCTDGVTDVLGKESLLEVLSDTNTAPEHKSLKLAEKVHEAGAKDNYTIQVLEFSEKVVETEPTLEPINRKNLLGIATIVLSLLLVISAFIFFPDLKNKTSKRANTALVKSAEVGNQKKEGDKTTVIKPEEKPIEQKSSEKLQQQKVQASKQTAPAIQGKPVYYEHEIKYGENLYRIAIRYNVTQKELIAINGSVAEKLIAGKKLNIPVTAIHKVASGESFSTLSNKYNVKISLIVAANKMEPLQALPVGKLVVIPKR